MRIEDFPVELTPVPGAMPVWRGTVSGAQWRTFAQQVRSKGGRLVALWGADREDRSGGFEAFADGACCSPDTRGRDAEDDS